MERASRRPLIEELGPTPPPPQAFELVGKGRLSFFLDSSMDPKNLGRYSFIGADPFLFLKSRGTDITVTQNGVETALKGDPLDVLGHYLEVYRLERCASPVPLVGGAVGYLSYDLCHFMESLPRTAVDDLELPECCLGFYDTVLAYDNLLGKAYIVSSGFPELKERLRLERARERLEALKATLKKPPPPTTTEPPTLTPQPIKGNFTHQGYVEAVKKARDYITAGDIFEVNLSQRFCAELSIPPHELASRLRRINPAPFAAYLGFDEATIVSASPERFLRVRGDWVETRPIKGTRRRGATAEEDRALAEELKASVKDHAENIMIVDLERNDLGRVCRYGSVKVTELAILETFPSVFHLTSTVEGNLKAGEDIVSLLRATFPGGSITGAPKVRAMAIIDELEPTRRSVYTGGIGYLGFNGDIDLNIVIRTFIIKGGKAYYQAGGAVTYDSDPESEYQETLDKARALAAALGLQKVEKVS